jgi:hypothetical protein
LLLFYGRPVTSITVDGVLNFPAKLETKQKTKNSGGIGEHNKIGIISSVQDYVYTKKFKILITN